MSSSRKPSRSYKAGKRGRHKHANSHETQKWNAEQLLPEQPSWMTLEAYRALAKLRRGL